MILRVVKALQKIKLTPSKKTPLSRWFSVKGGKTLRVEYDLNNNSIVFDLGGFEGQWASDIYSRYCSKILVFEPVPSYALNIRKRFSRNPDISVYDFGLSSASTVRNLSINSDASSMYKQSDSKIPIRLVKASDFMIEHKISHIDLMKINIEGGEYDLLDHLINEGLTNHITNIQIQFHDFVPDAKNRMHHIQEELRKTHETTYQFPFVWENWRLRSSVNK